MCAPEGPPGPPWKAEAGLHICPGPPGRDQAYSRWPTNFRNSLWYAFVHFPRRAGPQVAKNLPNNDSKHNWDVSPRRIWAQTWHVPTYVSALSKTMSCSEKMFSNSTPGYTWPGGMCDATIRKPYLNDPHFPHIPSRE